MGEVHDGWDPGEGYAAWSDAQLVDAVGAADRGALHELFVRHEPWLATRLSRRCADPALVDTALQDTFLSVWRKPRAWRGEGDVAAWLWGIAVRSLLHQLRPRANVVERLRNLLSPDLQAVVQATVLDGLTTREAAALLGIPSGTVKSRMSRARTQLREGLL